ncbi:MAG: hydrogenase nickel incorporation protein HypB [Lachnospiraceae bacterium]|nr:hydrogenase nickel incorporation protein HypB [Lachnospiraceae bacterium]
MAIKVIEINKSVYADSIKLADETRQRLKEQGTCLLNLMASPGAGKTTLLLKTIENLSSYCIGVMEADIEASVDAEKLQAAGVQSIQVHTGGECAMNASMTKQALDEFDTSGLDLVFLENVGNLVCPAEEDVGAHKKVALLSVPEGDDKPLKYPLMFQVVDAVVITKTDARAFFNFDDEAVCERIHQLNPSAEIFFVSAKTGEGLESWCDWVRRNLFV